MCELKSFHLWLLQVLALLGILAFLLWFIMRPKNPTYTVVDFTIPTSNTTIVSVIDQGNQNSIISYSLDIENPNKDASIYYDDIILTFLFGQDTVGERTIPSFHQGKGSTHHHVDGFNTNPRVWKALLNAVSNATAELKVGLVTKFRYRMLGHKSKHHEVNVQAPLPIGPDGKISGKKKLGKHSKKWRTRVT
ncbi:protein NDR1-like [Malania oleifera]|uniref:protein NDR1-like n=1 Tax=Malania oleifera TaxID=397392 RepID=UPI0025AEB217|nr:protein NDR1-like [Malania oleifera]